MKPAKVFHIMKMKKDRTAAISSLCVRATTIIPKSVKSMKLSVIYRTKQKNFVTVSSNPTIGYTIAEKTNTWINI
ncbi:hypothetical protein GQ55_2G198600 [Panicum hallii var. hallii]|uniref:Uncharacterized protein n=1 Tax=Panicum hallii var. hallii TaxID=1504633 RepID=A0A2T7EQJ6_9POAL|nr:hypothetical protein GQ55_2G198600 [Panicum hallii var. hallii]